MWQPKGMSNEVMIDSPTTQHGKGTKRAMNINLEGDLALPHPIVVGRQSVKLVLSRWG